jgi:ABC-type glycerol-3-phosphate transport system permease component
VASSSLSGYAFARFRVRVKRYIFPVVLATMMVPPIVLLIPMYLIFQFTGLLNTYWIWVLWGIGGSAYHIFLFRQFFSSIPADLIDAAKVDGCSPFGTYFRIVIPNSFGVFAASTIFAFRGIWSSLIEPMIYLTGEKLPFSVVLITGMNPPFRPDYAPDIPVQLAASFYYLLPIVLVFFLAQKYVIRGIITTGLKG